MAVVREGMKLVGGFSRHPTALLACSKIPTLTNKEGFPMREVIYTFPKSETESVQTSISEYRDKLYIDIRLFYKGDDGVERPTKKGLTLPAGLLLKELKKGVDTAVDHLSARTEEARV